MSLNAINSQHEEIIDQVLDLSGSPEEILDATIDLVHRNMPGWNWVGIYYLVGDHLVLGPYRGEPTEHTKIKVGVGVCGTAIKEDANIIVEDVTTLDNYLACSAGTKAEIVVLIRYQGRVVAQFDVDSDNVGQFTAADEEFLTQLAELVAPYCQVLAGKVA